MAIGISFINPQMIPYISTFLFVFALIFGLLSYSKIADFNKKVNAMIALAIAGFALLYEPLVVNLTQYMPIAVAVLIPVFFIALIKKVMEGKKDDQHPDTLPMLAVLAILLLLLIVLGGQLTKFLPSGIDPSNFLWIVGVVIAILFFWFIYKTKSP